MREANLHDVIEKLFSVVSEPPYDNVNFRITMEQGIYEIYIVFNLSEELYNKVKYSDDSQIEMSIARFEAYRLVRTIRNYLKLNIFLTEIGFRKQKN